MKWFLALGASVAAVATTQAAFAGGMAPTRYVHHNGSRLAVYESDGKKGPGVLLLHGNTSSASSYERVFDSEYAHTHHLVTFDFAGYGSSDNAASYDVGMFADEISFVAHKTGTDEGVIVGFSLGGDLALQASTIMPNVKGYFLFGTAPVGVDPSLPAPFLTAAESYAGAAVNYGFIATLTNAQVDDYVTAFFRPGYDDIPHFFYRDGRRTDPATRTAVATAGGGLDPSFHDEVAIVRSLTVPIAVLLGTQDAFVNPDFLNALAPSMPTLYGGQIDYVQGSGHAIHWEHENRFTRELRKFVKDATSCDD